MFTPSERRPDPPNAHDGRSRANRFSAPAALGLCGAILAAFCADSIFGPAIARELSFLPNRLLSPDGFWEAAHGAASLATYALSHADLSHVVLNLCLIAPFGALLETRYGSGAMLRIFWGSAIAGVLTHLLIYGGSHGLMGASAGASGLLAAWMRRRLRNGWAFFALTALWMATNHPRVFGVSESVAWQAHLGGFLAGLALAPAAEAEPTSPEAAPASHEASSSGK